IAIYIDRKGNVRSVTVGTCDLVKIPDLWLKRSKEGFSGVRCVHTHPSGNSSLSNADLSALVNLKLDAMVTLGLDKSPSASIAYLIPMEGLLKTNFEIRENLTLTNLLEINFYQLISSLENDLTFQGHLLKKEKETALLVIIDWRNYSEQDLEEVKEELTNLATTAGLEILDILVQKRDRKDPTYLIGKGKINELALKIQENQVDCVVFEDPLSPSQQSNLMEALGVKVLDRTNLILDIFAQRAKSKEGKLQVELAQLNYLLPRLIGQGVALSRLGGGVGTRGPGETKLETDRRHIRKRIQTLNTEIELIKKHRNLLQNYRKTRSTPLVALVGYTNAGKSSLLNALAQEDVFVEDKLFATLDPTTRNIKLNSQQDILLTDTVGFIRNLPHQLIESFKSTLEEVKLADLLLHVIDVTNENMDKNIKTVHEVLKELDCLDKPVIYVFNKVDLAPNELIVSPDYKPSCLISAKTGYGLEALKFHLTNFFFKQKIQVKVHIPFQAGYLLEKAYAVGKVEIEKYDEQGTMITLTTSEEKIPTELKNLIIME
ncbi:MAG: GTPase HflX, partial [Peptococcales bacterium]